MTFKTDFIRRHSYFIIWGSIWIVIALILLYAGGVITFINRVPLPGVGVIKIQRGWMIDQTIYSVNEKTLNQGITLLVGGNEGIMLGTSTRKLATLSSGSDLQSHLSTVEIQGHTFSTAAWSLGKDYSEQQSYAFSLETTVSPQKVVSISLVDNQKVATMIERGDSAEQIAAYVVKRCALSLN